MEALVLPDLRDVPLDALDGTRVLGLGGPAAAAVRRGFPAESFERLTGLLGVTAVELAAAAGLAPRTLTRRRAEGRLTPTESDRLLRLARLAELALVAFEDADAAAAWLREPKRLFGGESPLRHADTAPGARAVEDALYAIEFTAPF